MNSIRSFPLNLTQLSYYLIFVTYPQFYDCSHWQVQGFISKSPIHHHRSQSETAALQYLDSHRATHPELSYWYNTLADLYRRKLWHQLTLKLEQFVALAVFQAGDTLIQLYNNFITDFETKINLLKLAHFAVIVPRQYSIEKRCRQLS